VTAVERPVTGDNVSNESGAGAGDNVCNESGAGVPRCINASQDLTSRQPGIPIPTNVHHLIKHLQEIARFFGFAHYFSSPDTFCADLFHE
jgi:hypothetical protein